MSIGMCEKSLVISPFGPLTVTFLALILILTVQNKLFISMRQIKCLNTYHPILGSSQNLP